MLAYILPPSFSSSVSFTDCGRGSSLHFESDYPADFRIGEDGTVYAVRTLRISDRKGWNLEIHAKDEETQEVWLTQVTFALPDTPKQASLSLIPLLSQSALKLHIFNHLKPPATHTTMKIIYEKWINIFIK